MCSSAICARTTALLPPSRWERAVRRHARPRRRRSALHHINHNSRRSRCMISPPPWIVSFLHRPNLTIPQLSKTPQSSTCSVSRVVRCILRIPDTTTQSTSRSHSPSQCRSIPCGVSLVFRSIRRLIVSALGSSTGLHRPPPRGRAFQSARVCYLQIGSVAHVRGR